MKRLSVLLALLFVLALALVSCGNNNGETLDTATPQYSQGLKFISSGDGTCGLYRIGTCTDTDIVIPRTSPDGDIVTRINNAALCGESIASVVIPDSVTRIGDSAFERTNLTSVIIPDGVTSIGNEAFYGCKGLNSVVIPDSVTRIGGNAFDRTAIYNDESNWENNVLYICNHLISVKTKILSGEYAIKDDTLTIASFAFNDCAKLTSVLIPDSVISIGTRAFSGCEGLTSIVIPDSVESIEWGAFSHCTGLASVVIGDGVTSIGSNAFQFCDRLSSIVIPDSVISIGTGAFFNCDSLSNIYYTGSEEEWAKISISNDVNSDLTSATIHYNYVPEE